MEILLKRPLSGSIPVFTSVGTFLSLSNDLKMLLQAEKTNIFLGLPSFCTFGTLLIQNEIIYNTFL